MSIDLGDAVRASRRARRMSQTELAEQAGLSRDAVATLEKCGGRVSTLTRLLPYAPIRFVGLPPAGSIGGQVFAARRDANQSAAAVARLSGMSINTLKSVEAGSGSVAALVKILEALPQDVRVEPVLPRRPKVWRTVADRRNPLRPEEDYYATPAPLVRLLLKSVEFDRSASILEPAVGDARVIEMVLNEEGFANVTVSDINAEGGERRNFFDIEERFDVIITNPPFNRHVEWIVHAKKVARNRIALLLPLTYLPGAERHSLVWTDNNFPLAAVLVFDRGLNFLGDPVAEKLAASQLYCAWYIWDREHTGEARISWIDNHELINRRAA